MLSGQCPQCGGDAIYACHHHSLQLPALLAPLPPPIESSLRSYLCTGCGFIQVYYGAEKLVEGTGPGDARMAAIPWRRVDSQPPAHEFAECPKCGARLRGNRGDCSCGVTVPTTTR